MVREKAAAFRQLASMVAAGVSLSEALAAVSERTSHRSLKASLHACAEATAKGERLSEQLEQYKNIYPPLTVAMVRAGERSGRLEEIFKRLADYYERDYHLRLMLSRETFYPKVLLLAIIFIPLGGAAIRIWVLEGLCPAVAYFFSRTLLYGAIAAVPALAIWFAWRALRSSKVGSAFIDAVKLKIPLIGKVIRRLALARFARALATLYGAGVAMDEALELSGAAMANSSLSEKAYQASEAVKHGTGLTDALANAGLTDSLTISMLRTGEQTGNLEDTMVHLAEYYEDEAATAIRQMAIAIVPVAVIIAGIVVAIMLLNFYLGYARQLIGE